MTATIRLFASRIEVHAGAAERDGFFVWGIGCVCAPSGLIRSGIE
jgi:hypothetical protein